MAPIALVVNHIAVYDKMMINRLFFTLILASVGLFNAAAQTTPLDKLAKAQNSFEAKSLEEDVWAFWLETDSAVTDVLMDRAVKAEYAKRFDVAESLYDRIIRLDPKYPEVWHRRGLLNLRAERLDEAIFDFEMSIILQPRHFAVWTVLGGIFLEIEANAEALAAFDKALAIHPFYSPAQNGRKMAAKKAEGIGL